MKQIEKDLIFALLQSSDDTDRIYSNLLWHCGEDLSTTLQMINEVDHYRAAELIEIHKCSQPQQLLTTAQVASIFGISKKTVRRHLEPAKQIKNGAVTKNLYNIGSA